LGGPGNVRRERGPGHFPAVGVGLAFRPVLGRLQPAGGVGEAVAGRRRVAIAAVSAQLLLQGFHPCPQSGVFRLQFRHPGFQAGNDGMDVRSRQVEGAATVVPTAARGLPDPDLVGGPVAGPAKAGAVHGVFRQHRRPQHARIETIKQLGGIDWITSLSAPDGRKLPQGGLLPHVLVRPTGSG